MRILVTSPCYVESDGPVLIEPLKGEEPHAPEAYATDPQPLMRAYRTPRPTTALTCRKCGVRFVGRRNQKYCSPTCKQQYYRELKIGWSPDA
jgi:hypothetical protein